MGQSRRAMLSLGTDLRRFMSKSRCFCCVFDTIKTIKTTKQSVGTGGEDLRSCPAKILSWPSDAFVHLVFTQCFSNVHWQEHVIVV